MEGVEPGALRRAAGVVEVGERAGLEERGGFGVARDDAVGEAGDDLGDALHQIGRVEPGVALGDELACGSDVGRLGPGRRVNSEINSGMARVNKRASDPTPP